MDENKLVCSLCSEEVKLYKFDLKKKGETLLFDNLPVKDRNLLHVSCYEFDRFIDFPGSSQQ